MKCKTYLPESHQPTWCFVFALLVTIGSGEVQSTGRTAVHPADEIIEVQGISCTGRIEYHTNGKFRFCSLAREDALSGQLLPAGTGVHFREDSVFDWCFLQEDTKIQGIQSRGDGHGFMTEFHPNGQLKVAYLAEAEVIQNIPCAKFRFLSAVFWPLHGKNGRTSFHDNGRLSYCELSKKYTIEGQRFRRGAAVIFDENGKLAVETRDDDVPEP